MAFRNTKKRVAGSAFVINCRTDRQTLFTAERHGGVSNECYDVKTGEAVVTISQNNYVTQNSYGFTSMNGFNAPGVKKPIFLGVAETPSVFSKKSTDQGFVTRVGGIVTVLNGGVEQIHIGDPVKIQLSSNHTGEAADLNELNGHLQFQHNESHVSEQGIHPKKIRFVFAKQDEMNKYVVTNFERILNNEKTDEKDFLKQMGQIWDDWRVNVVGTAKSSARKGERFEMLLHRRHY
jgi:hypothetical protein